jgi:hypothetical protein
VFDRQIREMLGFKLPLPTIILTFVLFTGGIGMETAYGQSSAPFANCISLFMAGDAVQLSEDEDCSSSQWQEAVQYYKANGYPHEDSYMDFGYGKFIELDSDKFMQDKKDLGMD